MSTRRLEVLITGNAKDAQKAFRDLERDATKSTKGTTTALSGVQRGLTGLGAAAIGAGLWKSSQAASDLAESQGKVTQVFGESADEVQSFAKDAARSLGQSEQQALEAAGTFGNLVTSFGVGDEAAKDMSVTLTKLASDLASFNNTSVQDAIDALRSGLSGETEPLKRYGIALDDASLKAKALAMGIADGTSVLTPAQKAQAGYALILERSTNAQGDFARTADGAANKQKIATAEYENAKAALGEGLQPALIGVMSVAADAAQVFSELPDPVRNGALAVGGLSAAALVAAPRIIDMADSLKSMHASGSLGKITSGLAVAGAGITAFTLTLEALNRAAETGTDLRGLAADLKQVGEGSAELSDVASSLNTDIDGLGKAFAKSLESPHDWGDAIGYAATHFRSDTFSTGLKEAQKRVEELDSSFADMVASGNLEGARKAYGELAAELMRQGFTAEEVAQQLPQYWEEVERARRANKGATDATKENTGATKDNASATEGAGRASHDASIFVQENADALARHRKAAEEATEAIRGFYDEQTNRVSTQIDAERAIDAVTESVKEHGRELSIDTESGRQNREAIIAAKDAALEHSMALRDTSGTGAAIAAMDGYRQKLYETLIQSGYTEAQTQSLIAEMGLTPTDIYTQFGSNATEAEARAAAVKASIDRVPGLKNIYFQALTAEALAQIAVLSRAVNDVGGSVLSGTAGAAIQQSQAARQGPPRASGGGVKAGELYPINERGLEGFRPGVSGAIVPAHQMKQITAGAGGRSGGGWNVEIHITESGNAQDTAREVAAELRRLARMGERPLAGVL